MAQAHVIPDAIPVAAPRQAGTIGIVGSSPAVCGLVQTAARRGFHVRLVDPRPGAVETALETVSKSMSWLAARDRLDGVSPQTIARRIHASSSIHALTDATLVIEASGDSHEAKLAFLRELDAELGPDTIIATQTTTSSSVTELAAVARHPERIVGLHFVQPTGSDVVEVIRALQTSDEAHRETCRVVAELGKQVVGTKDQPGYLVHRLLIPFINEACFALQEGLGTVDDIDRAARLGSDAPGPLRMADAIGLDRCLQIAEQLQREFGDAKYRPAPLLRNYVAAGWLGRKSHRGFYSYPLAD